MISNLNLANHDLNYLEAKGCLLEEKQSLLFCKISMKKNVDSWLCYTEGGE